MLGSCGQGLGPLRTAPAKSCPHRGQCLLQLLESTWLHRFMNSRCLPMGLLLRNPGGEWQEKCGGREAEKCLEGQGGSCRLGERESRATAEEEPKWERGDRAERGSPGGQGEKQQDKIRSWR